MEERVRVAAVQLDVAWMNPAENIRRMCAKIDSLMKQQRADLVIFPELANCGYVTERNTEFVTKYLRSAETIPGPTTDALGAAAKAYGIHIVAGIAQRHPTVPYTLYNSAVLIGSDGNIIGVHHKNHLPINEKHYFYRGETQEIYQTSLGNIAMVVCYDLLFPEMIRKLALKGAEILCAVFNSPERIPFVPERLKFWAATRAYENRLYVIISNRVGEENGVHFHGNSVIVAPTGEVLAYSESDDEETLVALMEDSVLLRERGSYSIFLDRRPETY